MTQLKEIKFYAKGIWLFVASFLNFSGPKFSHLYIGRCIDHTFFVCSFFLSLEKKAFPM